MIQHGKTFQGQPLIHPGNNATREELSQYHMKASEMHGITCQADLDAWNAQQDSRANYVRERKIRESAE